MWPIVSEFADPWLFYPGGLLTRISAMIPWGLVIALSFVSTERTWARMPVIPALASYKYEQVNRRIAGHLLDFTFNHGCDRRIYSEALGQKRDLYVYLPPGYDGKTHFPSILWLHGIGYDEVDFLKIVEFYDCGIRNGLMPPCVIAAPDGSIRGKQSLFSNGSFYVNSKAGRFEDFVIHEAWKFLTTHFQIRPERDAHIIAGVSMGGFGAFNLGFKYRDIFGNIAGLMPPLNLRYCDCHGHYFSDYNPNCVTFRDPMRRNQIVGRFYTFILIKNQNLLDPLIGRSFPNSAAYVSTENPIELMGRLQIQPGEFGMFIGYGKRDQFNIDAQVEHFVDVATRQGIRPDKVIVIPNGHHDRKTAEAMIPDFYDWIQSRIGKFAPLGYSPNNHSKCGSYRCAISAPSGLASQKMTSASWLSPNEPAHGTLWR